MSFRAFVFCFSQPRRLLRREDNLLSYFYFHPDFFSLPQVITHSYLCPFLADGVYSHLLSEITRCLKIGGVYFCVDKHSVSAMYQACRALLTLRLYSTRQTGIYLDNDKPFSIDYPFSDVFLRLSKYNPFGDLSKDRELSLIPLSSKQAPSGEPETKPRNLRAPATVSVPRPRYPGLRSRRGAGLQHSTWRQECR